MIQAVGAYATNLTHIIYGVLHSAYGVTLLTKSWLIDAKLLLVRHEAGKSEAQTWSSY